MSPRSSYNYQDGFFLAIFAILAYWPVSFMVFSAKGDAINYFLAMRYNTSEALQHGYFPYWTPYINMGYPLHGDIQSGAWNPVVLLMSLIRQYDLYWLHTEIILINIIAGFGMYRLLSYLRLERKTILAVAVAYMLNGYITDAGQFLNWLYAAAFLPWVFLYLLRSFHSFTLRDSFFLGIAFSFMFLCAYPADSILLAYIIIAFTICSIVKYGRNNGWTRSLKKHARVGIGAGITVLLACLPAIISFIDFIPQIGRAEGVTIDVAMVNSLAPANLFSVWMPWPTMKGAAFAMTDPLIRNCYIGLITLAFLVYYFIDRSKKDLVQKFLVGMAVIFLLFSLGRYGGLRFITYHLLPLMNSFRHPANAKLFFLFAGQVLAAFAINRYLLNGAFRKEKLLRIVMILLSLTVIAFILALFKSNIISLLRSMFSGSASLPGMLKTARDQLSFYDLLFLNSILALVILVTTYILIKKGQLKRWLIPLMCVDLFIAAQLMLPLTYVRKATVSEAQAILNAQPKGYPLPDMRSSLAELSQDGEIYFEMIGCLNPYNKKPSRSEYIITPSNQARHDFFWDYTGFRKKIFGYPLAYFADTLFNLKDTVAFLGYDPSMKPAVVETIHPLSYERPDPSSITVSRFTPNHFEFEVNTNTSSFFVLHQNFYYMWDVRINGQSGPIIRTNLSFMGVPVPKGKSKIEFVYRKQKLDLLIVISIIFVLGGIIFFGFFRKNKPEAV